MTIGLTIHRQFLTLCDETRNPAALTEINPCDKDQHVIAICKGLFKQLQEEISAEN